MGNVSKRQKNVQRAGGHKWVFNTAGKSRIGDMLQLALNKNMY